ncbi:hypothetical protein PMAYCL1PPCAC_15963 [Pristionchus mayeri]|uniref:Uncharacterized protein n=1 Tax=Pristionchus mayeri TaxID=1317129 RepID=A0AAN5CJV0_9BILA|nr:hypothetical protein PMAYCL1PPCAC_15963 [Pristionchus mayeri]
MHHYCLVGRAPTLDTRRRAAGARLSASSVPCEMLSTTAALAMATAASTIAVFIRKTAYDRMHDGYRVAIAAIWRMFRTSEVLSTVAKTLTCTLTPEISLLGCDFHANMW